MLPPADDALQLRRAAVGRVDTRPERLHRRPVDNEPPIEAERDLLPPLELLTKLRAVQRVAIEEVEHARHGVSSVSAAQRAALWDAG